MCPRSKLTAGFRVGFLKAPSLKALVLWCVLLFVAHAANTAAATSTNQIGFLIPPEQEDAPELRRGAELAVQRFNRSHTAKAELLVRGRAGQWGADGVEAARMATDDGVVGLIAPPDGAATHLVLQVSGRMVIPVVTICPDSSVTKAGVPWMARVVAGTEAESALILRYWQRLGITNWAAIVPSGRSGREITNDFQRSVDVGAPREVYVANLDTIKNVSAQAAASRVEGILIWLPPVEAGRTVAAVRAMSFKGLLAGPGMLQSATFLTVAGAAAEGFLLCTPAGTDSPSAAEFRDTYETKFGSDPGWHAASAYDATRLLLNILASGDSQPAHRRFPLTFTLPGATGTLSFDAVGNRVIDLELRVVHSGKFVRIEKTDAL